MLRLMIIGNSNEQLSLAAQIAITKKVKVTQVANINIAINALRSGKGAEIVMIEVNQDFHSLIENLQQERISIPVIVCGSEIEKDMAIAAIKAGAKDYIMLPPTEEEIVAILESVCGTDEKIELIGRSPALLQNIDIVKKVANSTANVLITGASGTGKEVFARLIHQYSDRRDRPWIPLNCAAIPENLIESEMFGHEKGSFTGAIERRIGKFEESDGGTLFLDEISELPIHLQAKLLRAIQEKEIVRIGGNNRVKINMRIVASSNRNLLDEVHKQNFRLDLFYRLNVITLNLPSLKERAEDIDELAKFFIQKYSKLNNLKIVGLTEEAKYKLQHYSWPGNIRELENTIHRAILLAQDKNHITADEIVLLEPHINNPENPEELIIKSALEHSYGDYNRAANIIGASLNALRRRIDQSNAS